MVGVWCSTVMVAEYGSWSLMKYCYGSWLRFFEFLGVWWSTVTVVDYGSWSLIKYCYSSWLWFLEFDRILLKSHKLCSDFTEMWAAAMVGWLEVLTSYHLISQFHFCSLKGSCPKFFLWMARWSPCEIGHCLPHLLDWVLPKWVNHFTPHRLAWVLPKMRKPLHPPPAGLGFTQNERTTSSPTYWTGFIQKERTTSSITYWTGFNPKWANHCIPPPTGLGFTQNERTWGRSVKQRRWVFDDNLNLDGLPVRLSTSSPTYWIGLYPKWVNPREISETEKVGIWW